MPVIAMTREMGSLGRDVALGLAEEFGLTLVQHEIVDHVADKMHLGSSAVNRFLEGKANLLERWGIDEKSVTLYTAEEILGLASKGNVLIRGWGATYLLRPVSHVLCVRVCAPMAFRTQVMVERLGMKESAAARREIEKNDAAHSRVMMQLFHADWQDPLLYDIVLNTGHIPVAACVDLIKQLAQQPAFEETPASRTKLADLTLEAQIRSALRGNNKTRRLDSLFDIALESGSGKVTLSGMVDNDDMSYNAETVVASVPGVKSVDNKLIVATHLRYGP